MALTALQNAPFKHFKANGTQQLVAKRNLKPTTISFLSVFLPSKMEFRYYFSASSTLFLPMVVTETTFLLRYKPPNTHDFVSPNLLLRSYF